MPADTSSPFGPRRYRAWNDHVKARHGGRVQKISVLAGFTCPNRDGLLGKGGCTFCNNASFTPSYLEAKQTITAQLDEGLDYLAALSRSRIIELEIGVESCDDTTLARVNRGHTFAASVDAIERAAARGLEVTAHLLLGLPGESVDSMLDGARRLSALPIHALKLHQLQVVRGTLLARDWQRNPQSVPLLGEADCISLLADFIERLSPRIWLQRVGSEVPPSQKLAPEWNLRLSELAARLSAELARRGSWQGSRYPPC